MPYGPFIIYSPDLKLVNGIAFTEREIDIIAEIISGKSSGAISKSLNISSRTVDSHTRNIMLKLGCNSRERIISFVEQSGAFEAFRRHHLTLLLEYEFLSQLQKVRRLIHEEEVKCELVLMESIDNKDDFLNKICFHLQQAGIRTKAEESSEDKDAIQGHKFIILTTVQGTSSKEPKGDIVNIELQESYYHVIFAILDKTISHPYLKNIKGDFQNQYDLFRKGLSPVLRPPDAKPSQYAPNSRILRVTIACIALCIIVAAVYSFRPLTNNKSALLAQQPVRSDLIIPISTAFLERPEIIKKMNDRLKKGDGIQAIALTGVIGIGGAGKTTIARYFAKSMSDASIVWELNAETRDTLVHSFRSLAYMLAHTAELKKDLDFIRQVQDTETQEKLLLNFVKTQLKAKPGWLLIYDNMESFAQINHLFPHSSTQWGKGKVIITTRNEHIAETSYIKPKNIIHIDELSNQETLTLFSKILYDLEASKLKQPDHDKVIDFLKNIPPFPLDVSVAAYSIKNTHLTFEQYLKHVHEYSKNYETMQVKLLKEVTDYSQTRYGIISSTVEKLSKIDPNFKKLFFFICLLDSQNIPCKLLENYNNAKMVDDLVYSLRQNGLLLRESYSDFAKESKVISLHRSTQEIGAAFLINSLTEKEKEYLIEDMVRAINNFYQSCNKNKDVNNITLLITHLNALLNAIPIISISQETKARYEADLYLTLGNIHYKWTKNLILVRNYFKTALKNNNHFSPQVSATVLKNLCATCVTMNLLEEALGYCKKSVALCKIFPNSESILADNFQIMGNYHRKNNNFEKARKFLEEALETILKVEYEDLKELKAEIYTQLSHLYLMHYLNKKEGRASEEYARKALEALSGLELFYMKAKPLPPHISCHVARHRWKYSEVLTWHYANYDSAYHNLRETEYIMNNKCPGDMHLKGRMYATLAEVFLRKNNLLEAEKKVTEAIDILSVALGPNTTWTYNVRRAEIKIRLGKFNDGYEDCLKIFRLGLIEKTNFHDLRYLMAFYHGAFAQYKLKDHQKSMQHFADFLKGMDDFCKKFFDEKAYDALKTKGVFVILPYNAETGLRDIKTYLNHSLVIYTAILGEKHPFVQEYVAKNI